MGKNTLPLPTLDPHILKKTSQVSTSTACSNLKRMRKSLPDLCAPEVKLPTLSYWFLEKVSLIFENTERMKKSV